ncbi:acetoin dehydrogenase dihydrolipoyllysine-residue acetyltransferase subunit [Nitratireductor sp. GCM10026969]|uniref:acetoin dehydrogenase dihydrolipoyllysine-residue acetyltransferase subunit n=1 Tax=Nitratireductor sp. GCM10026969 TaxID=3252645 RepID=UPI00360768D8
MPKVDMDMAAGKVMSWHVAPGQKVEKGDPLFDIETDKAAMEVEAPYGGFLHHPVAEGTEVPIGQPVAWLYAEGEEVDAPPAGALSDAPDPASVEEPELAPRAWPAPEPEATHAAPAQQPGHGIRATPLARSLARKSGVELDGIAGTGVRGRIQAEDVRAFLDSARPGAGPARFTPEAGALAVTRSKGGEGTPVVLLHGFASDAASWAPLEAHLHHRPVIRFDLPNHGKSPKRRIADFAALVSELRHAFDALGLDKAHLVGHSLGGAVALALADTRPRSVASLTLIAPGGLGPEINDAALSGICRASRPESLGPWLKTLVAREEQITDAYVRAAMAARKDAELRAAQAAMCDVLFPDGVQAFDLKAALKRVEIPTRILWGRQDQIIPWRHALHAPGRVALHLFDDLGHMPQFEAVDEVGNLLRTQLW